MSRVNILFECEKCARRADFVMRIDRLEDIQGDDDFVCHPHRAALICEDCAWAEITREPWFTVRLPEGGTQHVVSKRMAASGLDFDGVTTVPSGATPARVFVTYNSASLTFDEISPELGARVQAVADAQLSAILFEAVEERDCWRDLDSLA